MRRTRAASYLTPPSSPDETLVQALRDLAVEWQDQHLVQLCDRALVQGDPEAVADCKRIFHDAFALLRGHRGEL